MLRVKSSRKMAPRHSDGLLHVLIIGRVSTERQEESNIEAGYEYARPVIKQVYEGEILVKELGEVASGMLTNRPTILEALALIEAGWPDLVLMEDLSKAYRNPAFQIGFVQTCFDKRIRCIAVGDNLDTWDENWEITLAAATLQHGTHIPHTRRRVRRSATAAFHSGGMVLRVRAGYQKITKEDAATGQFGPKGLRMVKGKEWVERVTTIRRMILDQILPSAHLRLDHVVDWMNDQSIPTGPYCKRKDWTVKLLVDWLRDPILYGWRRHRQTVYEYVYGTGAHTREKNLDPEREYVPELAFMTEAEWEELQRALKEILASRSNPKGEQHPRYRVPRHNSISPDQHMQCLCESFYYDAGKDCVKCSKASHKPDGCWNHVLVEAERARIALVDIALTVVEGFPGAKAVMLDAAWEELERRRRCASSGLLSMEKEISDLEAQASRLATAIKLGCALDAIVAQSKAIEKALNEARKKKEKLTEAEKDSGIPNSREVLELDPRAALIQLARTSFRFSDLMRRIFPRFVIQPVQALDSGLVRPRALLVLDLGALLDPNDVGPRPPTQKLEVDLFDPPEHIEHLAAVVSLQGSLLERGEKSSLQILAAKLGIGRMTVKRALGYAKLMAVEGLTDPYRVLGSAPATASRWKPRVRPRPMRRSA